MARAAQGKPRQARTNVVIGQCQCLSHYLRHGGHEFEQQFLRCCLPQRHGFAGHCHLVLQPAPHIGAGRICRCSLVCGGIAKRLHAARMLVKRDSGQGKAGRVAHLFWQLPARQQALVLQDAAQGAAHLNFFLPQLAAFAPGKHQGVPAGKGQRIGSACGGVHAQQERQVVARKPQPQHAPQPAAYTLGSARVAAFHRCRKPLRPGKPPHRQGLPRQIEQGGEAKIWPMPCRAATGPAIVLPCLPLRAVGQGLCAASWAGIFRSLGFVPPGLFSHGCDRARRKHRLRAQRAGFRNAGAGQGFPPVLQARGRA